jgi:hypothetical protein
VPKWVIAAIGLLIVCGGIIALMVSCGSSSSAAAAQGNTRIRVELYSAFDYVHLIACDTQTGNLIYVAGQGTAVVPGGCK